MIRSVTSITKQWGSVKMELESPEKSGFAIFRIEGIGPGKANINSTELATSDGSVFNSAKLPSRNITISIKYLGNPETWDARRLSYKYFPIKESMTLLFESDGRRALIDGIVESNEPVIFSRETYTQISVVCPFPYFYSENIQVTQFSGVVPIFEFPFSNENLNNPLLIMSELRNENTENVHYTGDGEVGITIYIRAIAPVEEITIWNLKTRQRMHVDGNKIKAITGKGITKGDEIIISTVSTKRYVRLLREGVYTNILSSLGRNSDWFSLIPGDNIFAFETEDIYEPASSLTFRIENQILYGGI